MDIFKISTQDKGKEFIVRPLPNIKDLNNNILSYRFYFNEFNFRWSFRYLCYALVNGNLEIFNFPEEIRKYITPDILSASNNIALKIKVDTKQGFLNNQYELIEDDLFSFNRTKESKAYIENLLTSTDLDLEKALDEEKDKISHIEISIPNADGSFTTKTLGDIYKSENK